MTERDSLIEDEVQPTLNLSMGQWVVVNYDGEMFPGEVTHIDNSDVEVSVMHRSANAWKWPRPEDKIFYSKTKLYVSLNHQVLQAIEDSLYLKTFSSYIAMYYDWMYFSFFIVHVYYDSVYLFTC